MEIIDLTNCDREPIHIPGKVQSHGFLLAVDHLSYTIRYVSENINEHLGEQAQFLLEKPIDSFIALLEEHEVGIEFAHILSLGKSQGFDLINPYKLMLGELSYYLIIHQSGNNLVLEFETTTLQYDIQHIIGRSVAEILSNSSIQQMLQKATVEVKRIIEYDRVMVYSFQEDGHGEVVAEERNEDLEPFLGLHYPASDIPKQARELYRLNMTRIIADVNTESSPILTFETATPLDLTHATLRSVSPIHIQYLKNMGVQSSFSISLLAHGELWGLIACHNYTPKFIDFKAREGCKLIGNILSSAIAYKQSEVNNENDELYQQAVEELSAQLEKDSDIIQALTKHHISLLAANSATGVAIVFENQTHILGEVPDESQLKKLFKWLNTNMDHSIYDTNQLTKTYQPAAEFDNIASGILVCMLSKEMGEMIVWFKKEKLKTINWAGNPQKPMEKSENGMLNLSPRNSFATFVEIVKGTTQKWSAIEIKMAIRLKEKINNTINKRADEIRKLNERLQLAYEELDTFSYTISHDLRTPLTSIRSYTQLYLAKHKPSDDNERLLLDRVISGTDRMRFLIDEILKLAHVGRMDIELTKIDIKKMVTETIQEVLSAYEGQQITVTVGECPEIDGDQTMIGQVFNNIISNAIKYSSKTATPTIAISGSVTTEEVTYMITDNGIGIVTGQQDKVFGLFQRMENVKDYEGTGVGLAIVKRIIERHNGRIWFESEQDIGTTFYIAFNRISR